MAIWKFVAEYVIGWVAMICMAQLLYLVQHCAARWGTILGIKYNLELHGLAILLELKNLKYSIHGLMLRLNMRKKRCKMIVFMRCTVQFADRELQEVYRKEQRPKLADPVIYIAMLPLVSRQEDCVPDENV